VLKRRAEAGDDRRNELKVNRGLSLIATLTVVLGLFLVIGRPVRAQQAKASGEPKQAKRRLIPLTINKGETYVISNVSVSGAPGIKVVANPNALVVNTDASGKVVLVGADTGSWNIDLTLATGERVTYSVSVKADAPPQGSLDPGSAPTPIP